MKKAAIIADYGKNTGMGHLVRCGSLAKELSKSFTIRFVCLNDEYFPFVKEYAQSLGVSAVAIEDLSYVFGYVKADLIVVDSYKATAKFLTDIKNYYEVCAIIDDNASFSFYDADVIINQNIGAQCNNYRARKDTQLLLGLEYLMLREEFAEALPIDILKEVKNIVVTMGGTDVKNTTAKVLKLVEKYKEYVFNVVAGQDFLNAGELEQFASRTGNIKLHYSPSMPELFSNCQAAVSACGSTVYELASMGVPTVGIVTADNQQDVSLKMEEGGIIVSAGLAEKLSDWYFDQLFDDVVKNAEFRKKMHETQVRLIAKNGARRIADKLLERF